MLGRVLLFTGGMIQLTFVESYLKNLEYDAVICADSGLDAAYALQLPVQYALGDFDSVSKEILAQYQQGQIPGSEKIRFVQYPTAKDYTDTQMALEWILEQGATEITIFGATGGRLDHFLATVNVLMKPLKKGVPTYIVDRQNRIRLVNGTTVLRKEEAFGKYISLQPLSEKVYPLTLQGLEYSLQDYTLCYGDGRAISNEFAAEAEEAVISFTHGELLVIESRDDASCMEK